MPDSNEQIPLDEHSPGVLFGKVIERVDGLREDFADFKREVKTQINGLQCNTEAQAIVDIKGWIGRHEEKHQKFEDQKTGLIVRRTRFRDNMVVGIASAGIGAATDRLVWFFTKAPTHLAPSAERIFQAIKALFRA